MRPVQSKNGVIYSICILSNLKTVLSTQYASCPTLKRCYLLNMHPAQPKYGLSTLLLIKSINVYLLNMRPGTRTTLLILNDDAENPIKF